MTKEMAKCFTRRKVHKVIVNPFPNRYNMHKNFCVDKNKKDQRETKMKD
jgi:hypothetical protein